METNVIHNESCLDTLGRMADDSIDIVVTSPPYNMNLRINKGRYCSRQITKEFATKYEGFADNLPLEEYNSFHSGVLSELLRVSDLVFYNIQIVTGSKRSVFKMIGEFAESLKDIIVWDKGHGQPAMKAGVLNRQSELLLVFEKSYPISRQFRESAQFERGTLSDVWNIKRERTTDKGNTAVMPKALATKILTNFSAAGSIVYDPFCGTGTTCVAAKETGRQYIGSETSSTLTSNARKRLREVQIGLFNEGEGAK